MEQGGQTEGFEVRIGEPGREGSTAGEIPRTAAAAGRVPGSPWRDPVGDQCRTAMTWCFPLTPQRGPQSQPDPASESDQHLGRFAEAKIVAPAPHIRSQLLYRRLHTDALGPARDLSDAVLKAVQGLGRDDALDLRTDLEAEPVSLSFFVMKRVRLFITR